MFIYPRKWILCNFHSRNIAQFWCHSHHWDSCKYHFQDMTKLSHLLICIGVHQSHLSSDCNHHIKISEKCLYCHLCSHIFHLCTGDSLDVHLHHWNNLLCHHISMFCQWHIGKSDTCPHLDHLGSLVTCQITIFLECILSCLDT